MSIDNSSMMLALINTYLYALSHTSMYIQSNVLYVHMYI